MKRKLISFALALSLVLALAPAPARALGAFSDVSDAAVARNVEVLQLMGVIGGDDTGRFHPYDSLTRAQFCKMTIELQGRGNEVPAYRARTVFPDVRASHWASGYVNLASAVGEKTPGLMHGFPDGTFQPEKTISYGEAITVLMRALGYTDAEAGAVWPQGYLDLGAAKGLTKGLALSGGDAINRAQAAQLFVNVLGATKSGGGTMKKLGDETTLLSADLAKGQLRTADGKRYDMTKPMPVTLLAGLKGRVVFDDKDKALTFLPSTTAIGSSIKDGAILASADGSTAGFETLTGGKTDYAIYKNGVRASRSAIRKNDVVTYAAGNNAILLCDTRVTVYYENCSPSQSEPTEISALGGTRFPVLKSAQQSLSKFKPGQQMVLLLTTDGQVAGASNSINSNSLAYVNRSGQVSLICGGNLLELACTDKDHPGAVVTIAQDKDKVSYGERISLAVGQFNASSMTLGSRKLADNVLVLSGGELLTLSQLKEQGITTGAVSYAHVNWDDQADIVVLDYKLGGIYGRVSSIKTENGVWSWYDGHGVKETQIPGNGYLDEDKWEWHWYSWYTGPKSDDDKKMGNGQWKDGIQGGEWQWYDGHGPYFTPQDEGTTGSYLHIRYYTIDCGSNGSYGPYAANEELKVGDIIAAEVKRNPNSGSQQFYDVKKLEKLPNIPASAWIGKNAVNVGDKTYYAAGDMVCFNSDTEMWLASFDEVLDYGGKMNLYVMDGMVRVIEVSAK